MAENIKTAKTTRIRTKGPIARFFSGVFSYIAENAWLQPFLLVGLIFIIIFNITNFVGWMTALGDWLGIGNESYLTKLTFDELEAKINDNEEFVVVFVQDGCSFCTQFKPVLNKVLKTNPDAVIYSVDITKVDDLYNDSTITALSLQAIVSDVQDYYYRKNPVSPTEFKSMSTPLTLKYEAGITDSKVTDLISGSVDGADQDYQAVLRLLGID